MKITFKTKTQFQKYESSLIRHRKAFTVTLSGSTKSITYKGNTISYADVEQNKGKGFHISKMVHRDVDLWLAQNEHLLNERSHDYKEHLFNLEAIRANIGKPLLSVDINNCYWVTLLKMGFITDKTYIMGLRKKKDWKLGRNASVGGLAKSDIITPFLHGKPVYGMKTVKKADMKYQYVRNNVIGSVYDMFVKLHQEIGSKFMMYMVDCVVTDPNSLKYVKRFFNQMGYQTKVKTVVFTKIDEATRRIYWDEYDKDEINHKYYWYAKHQLIQ